MENTTTYTQTYTQAYAQAYAQPAAQPYEQAYAPAYAQPAAHQPRYAAPKKAKVPGRTGAIARLVTMFLIAGFGLIGCIVNLFTSPAEIGARLLDSLNSAGLLLTTACFVWIMMKWIVFMAPKSFGLAKRFWQSWHALSIFGLYLKCVVFLLISIPPVSAISLAFMPVSAFMSSTLVNGLSFLPGLGMTLLGGVLMVVLTFLDVCKLRGAKPLDAVKDFFAARKR